MNCIRRTFRRGCVGRKGKRQNAEGREGKGQRARGKERQNAERRGQRARGKGQRARRGRIKYCFLHLKALRLCECLRLCESLRLCEKYFAKIFSPPPATSRHPNQVNRFYSAFCPLRSASPCPLPLALCPVCPLRSALHPLRHPYP